MELDELIKELDNKLNISNNTILRIIKKTKIEVNYEVENLGIDDFSSKKREHISVLSFLLFLWFIV